MGTNGGARAGAGRKPKLEKHATAIALAEKKIKDRLPDLIDNLFRLADGVTVQEESAEGKPITYTNPPDRQANEYLVNRIMGKPVDRKEISGQNGGDINFNVATKNEASVELEEWRRQVNAQLNEGTELNANPVTAPNHGELIGDPSSS